jgi:hypothetical protein
MIKVLPIKMIPVAELVRMHDNANIMTRENLSDLIARVEKRGFDQILTVFWNEEMKLYEVTKGNHRFEAGKSLGILEFPCTVGEYDNRDEAVADSIADNITKGELQEDLLARNINNLISRHGKAKVEDMLMIRNKRALKQVIKTVRQSLPPELREEFDKAKSDIKDIDDIAMVIRDVVEKRGHTQELGFIYFNLEGKTILSVTMDALTNDKLKEVTDLCEKHNININKMLQEAMGLWMGQPK